MLKIKTTMPIPAFATVSEVKEVIEQVRGVAVAELNGDLLKDDKPLIDVTFIITSQDPAKVAMEVVGITLQIEEINANLDGTNFEPIDLDDLEYEVV